ncbi:Acid-sensing ion channel 1 [Mactra antiquata]
MIMATDSQEETSVKCVDEIQVEFSDSERKDDNTSAQSDKKELYYNPLNENNRPKSRFWESILLWSQTTTFHGVHRVVNIQSHTFRRVTWFILISTMWVFVIWYCQGQMNRYFQYKTLMLDIVNTQKQILFPAVTICKHNFVHTDSVNSTDKVLIEELLHTHPNKTRLLSEFGESYLNEAVVDFESLLLNHASNINEVILSCKIDGSEFNCNTFHQVLSNFGQCLTFNSSVQQELSGDDHGMELLLWLGEDNTFPFNPTAPIFKFKFMENPVKAYGRQYCINTELSEFKHYTITACYEACRQNYIYKLCGCVDPFKTGIVGNKCTILKYVDCYKPALLSFQSNKDECYCPPPCHLTKYHTNLHSVYLPDRSFNTWNNQLSLNKSLETLRQNMLVLKLFYNSKNIIYHEQTLEYKFEDIWASFGGIFGLATGASILSFVELFDLLVWNLYYHYQNIVQLMRGDVPTT